MSYGGTIPPSGHAREVAAISQGDRVIVPYDGALISGQFIRTNNDLILTLEGKKFVFHDYFNAGKLATLESPTGATLTGDAVARLANTHKAIGNLESAAGWVTVVHADGTIIQANSGESIYKGDVVQTGSDSTATVRFIDGTTFDISADSRTTLDGLIPDGLLNSTAQKPIQVAMSDVS